MAMQTAAKLVFLVPWSEVKQKLQIRQWNAPPEGSATTLLKRLNYRLLYVMHIQCFERRKKEIKGNYIITHKDSMKSGPIRI